MKRVCVIVGNVLLMIAMVVFVVVYAVLDTKKSRQTQIEHFEASGLEAVGMIKHREQTGKKYLIMQARFQSMLKLKFH